MWLRMRMGASFDSDWDDFRVGQRPGPRLIHFDSTKRTIGEVVHQSRQLESSNGSIFKALSTKQVETVLAGKSVPKLSTLRTLAHILDAPTLEAIRWADPRTALRTIGQLAHGGLGDARGSVDHAFIEDVVCSVQSTAIKHGWDFFNSERAFENEVARAILLPLREEGLRVLMRAPSSWEWVERCCRIPKLHAVFWAYLVASDVQVINSASYSPIAYALSRRDESREAAVENALITVNDKRTSVGSDLIEAACLLIDPQLAFLPSDDDAARESAYRSCIERNFYALNDLLRTWAIDRVGNDFLHNGPLAYWDRFAADLRRTDLHANMQQAVKRESEGLPNDIR